MSRFSTSIICILFISAYTFSTGADKRGPDDVVRLSAFHVDGGALDVTYHTAKDGKTIVSAEVSWVSPKLQKGGLHIGDALISVDGVPTKGMSVSDYLASASAKRMPGEKSVLIFRGPRGLFRRATTLTLTITPKPEQPAKSPETDALGRQ